MGVGLGLDWEVFATGDGSKVGSMVVGAAANVGFLSFKLGLGLGLETRA